MIKQNGSIGTSLPNKSETYKNVVIKIIQKANAIDIVIYKDISTVSATDNPNLCSGLYYEACDITFDYDTKIVEITNLKTVVTIEIAFFNEMMIECGKVDKDMYSLHQIKGVKKGWLWNRKTIYYNFISKGEYMYYRSPADDTKIILFAPRMIIEVR